MQIVLTKLDHRRHRLEILRRGGAADSLDLETSVYLLHDLAHFAVETALHYEGGFWGMLAAGHSLSGLGGKANPLTDKLRFIEKIVGPVQSAYMGHFPASFVATATAHLDVHLPGGFAEQAIAQLSKLEAIWKALPFGGTLELDW